MGIAFAKTEYPYACIPAEKRRDILPEHNICSISPAREPADDFITGSGALRVQASGRPYTEEISYTQETLYEPLWEKTPLPPDLRPYLPRIRELLLRAREAYEKREELLKLRAQILLAEERRIYGAKTISIQEAREALKNI